MLQRNVSLTWFTYVVVTMHGTSRLLDNHQIRGGEGQDVGEQTRRHNIPHNTGLSRVPDICCYGTKHTSSPCALSDYRASDGTNKRCQSIKCLSGCSPPF